MIVGAEPLGEPVSNGGIEERAHVHRNERNAARIQRLSGRRALRRYARHVSPCRRNGLSVRRGAGPLPKSMSPCRV